MKFIVIAGEMALADSLATILTVFLNKRAYKTLSNILPSELNGYEIVDSNTRNAGPLVKKALQLFCSWAITRRKAGSQDALAAIWYKMGTLGESI